MRYSALAPGKRLRPVLLMACCEAVGGDIRSVMEAAAAVELVHCFSLIHDDLPAIDDDDLRRGMPTCHIKFGEAIAVLAGDSLFALAFKAMASLKHPAESVVRCLNRLADVSGSDGLVGGEVVDVLTEGKPYTALDLDFIHRKKTGVLIQACCEIGALLGNASDKDYSRLSLYGDKIGLAFQVADDILNETGSAEQMGKAANTDALRQKATYPAHYGLDGAKEAANRLANEALAGLDDIESEPLRYLASYVTNRMS